MKRLLLVAVVALLAVPAAQGKGPTRVCGASGCLDMATEAETFGGAVRLSIAPGTPTLGAVAPAPYFRIDGIGGPQVWVPSRNALRVGDEWVAPLANELALLRDKTAGLAPFGVPRHASAFVDWNRVRNGDGYIRLATLGVPVAAAPRGTRWIDVWVMGGDSPWNDGSIRISVSRNGYLLRDGRVLRIPVSLAKRVLARKPL
jgi:hypothetical protein